MKFSRWRESSSWSFFLYVFAGLMTVVLVLTTVHAFFLHRRQHNQLDGNLAQVEKIYLPLLVSNLWITDYDSLKEDIEGIVKFSYIQRVEVAEEGGRSFFSGVEVDPSSQVRSMDLVYDYRGVKRKIGDISLFIDIGQMHTDLVKNVLILLYIQLFATLVISLIIGGIFHFMIGRHLRGLADFMEKDDPSTVISSFTIDGNFSRKNELGLLVDHFNGMRERIRNYVGEIREWRDLMHYVIQHDPSAIMVLDRDMKFIFVSDKLLENNGLLLEDVIGKSFSEVLPHLEGKWTDILSQALRGEILNSEDDVILRQDGRIDNLRWYCRPWFKADGQIEGTVYYSEVISERKKMERALFVEKELFRTTLFSVGDGFISTDNDGKVLLMNRVARELTGWDPDEARGKAFSEVLNIVNEKTREKAPDPVKEVLYTGETFEMAQNCLLVSKSGKEIPIEDSAAPVRDIDGDITGVVVVFRDCTDKRKRQQEIEYLSYHDQLTGLYNRRFFEEEVNRLDVPRNLPLALAMLDVNGLKLFNDAFGHLMGDRLLKRVAEVLKKECRADDIIARTGGDEFVVLLPKTASDDAVAIMDRVSEVIKGEKIEDIPLSISWGVDVKTDRGESIEKVFEKAEDSMYRNKISEKTSYHHRSVQLILETLFARSEFEKSHSENVGALSERVGKAMGLSRAEAGELRTAGVIHDIGKIATPGGVLGKASALEEEEWDEIRKHPETGFSILSTVSEYGPLAEVVFSHHERWDGTGYPRGLRGENIPLFSRIIAVAEAWDAMIAGRPWKRSLSEKEAITELESCAGTQFDPDVVKVFFEIISSPESGEVPDIANGD